MTLNPEQEWPLREWKSRTTFNRKIQLLTSSRKFDQNKGMILNIWGPKLRFPMAEVSVLCWTHPSREICEFITVIFIIALKLANFQIKNFLPLRFSVVWGWMTHFVWHPLVFLPSPPMGPVLPGRIGRGREGYETQASVDNFSPVLLTFIGKSSWSPLLFLPSGSSLPLWCPPNLLFLPLL